MLKARMHNKVVGGFTLVELMIVIAIIGIIAAFAYPSYRKHIIKTHRSDAIKALSKMAISQERFLSLNNEYSTDTNELGMTISSDGFYDLDVVYGRWSGSDCSSASSPSDPNKRQYTLFAIPVADKSQAEDTDCGCLYIDDAGNKQATGSNTARCWK